MSPARTSLRNSRLNFMTRPTGPSACLVFERADAIEKLAGEYGSGVVQAKVAPEALGLCQAARGARREQRLLARSGRRLEQPEFDVATHQRDSYSRLARDHGELDQLLVHE